MKFNRFEEIQAWQKAKELCVLVYRVFGESRDFGFKDQIQRASVSIMNNIAEGFERRSNKEFRHFLYVERILRRSSIHTHPRHGIKQNTRHGEFGFTK